MNGNCPRCQGKLRTVQYEPINMHVCEKCKGALVKQRDLVRLLQFVAQETEAMDQANSQIEAVPDKGAGVICPVCCQVMDHYGYMESNLVMIDGCMPCQLVWIDTDELGVMSLMYSRSRRYLAKGYMEQETTDLVSRLALARAAEGWLVGIAVWH